MTLKGPHHETIRGTLQYTSKKPDRMNIERGRKYFTLTKQGDGTSTLYAHCEIDDNPNVIRDVTCAFDTKSMRPFDAMVRISVGSKFEGSGWCFGSQTNLLNAKLIV